MGVLRRRIQVKRVRDRDQGNRMAYEWRVSVARTNRRPEVAEGVLLASRDGSFAPHSGSRGSQGFGAAAGVLASERGRSGEFPERVDLHEAPRPDPNPPAEPPLSHRRGESGLGLATLGERAERDRRSP